MNWKQLQGQSVSGEFQLLEYLGGDDNCATFLATGTDGAKVAVKLLFGDSHHAERWVVAETLSHPNLLKILRSGSWEAKGAELSFLVTEYAEENLSQVVTQRPLTADEAREMLPAVLDVLDYLHGQGFVHGHLKPANIMAVADQLKLSVDGVLKSGETLSRADFYAAPEASAGVTAASDLWSLGITLTEVLTQRRPAWEEGNHLPELPAGLPDQFRLIVQRCLMHDPALRATTAFVRERLQATAPAPPPTVVAVPAAERAAKKSKRQKLMLIPAVAAVAIGAVIAITHKEAPPPQSSTIETAEQPNPAPPPERSPAPAVFTEATDPRPQPEKPSPEKPQKMEVLVEPVVAPNTPPPPKSAKDDAAILQPPPRRAAEVASVSPGSGAVVHQVLPDIPRKALNTINGKFRVEVKVQVDRGGNVVNSEFVSRGPSKYFADRTMQAVKDWKFIPAEQSLRAWNLEFEFRRSGVSTNSSQVD